jgi:non-specific serine/threonine protein kinase
LARARGDDVATALALDNLGVVAYFRRDFGRAVALVEEALALQRRAAGISFGTGYSLNILAMVHLEQGAYERAAVLAAESLAINWRVGTQGVSSSLEQLAHAAAGRGQPARAARLFGAAAAYRAVVGAPFASVQQGRYEQGIAAVRAELGDAAFAAAWAAGAALPLGEAVAEALTVVAAPADSAAAGGTDATAAAYGLTPRERDVLRLLVEGRSDAEIADALFIAPRTARAHVASILAKLGVPTRTAAATHAVRHGLI